MSDQSDRDRLLSLQNEHKELEDQAVRHRQTIERLRSDLDRAGKTRAREVAAAVAAAQHDLISYLASPAAQLQTQARLLDSGAKLDACHVMKLAQELVQALQLHGLRFEGAVGDCVAYNEGRHRPASPDQPLAHGQTVIIRVPGVTGPSGLVQPAVVASDD